MHSSSKSVNKPILVLIGTYPPRECGIGTFTQDLVHSLKNIAGSFLECRVAAFNISSLETYEYPDEVFWEIDQEDLEEHKKLASDINKDFRIDSVIIQHEYGIYGGDLGENIITFLKECKKNKLICLHTVLPNPDEKLKSVTRNLIKYSDIVVVLTKTSKDILERVYPESSGKVFVIPHGIHPINFTLPMQHKKKLKLSGYTVLSTFGLLSRGKGIEYVIKALPPVVEMFPEVRYLVLGETHPVLRRKEGESYRMELIRLVRELGLTKYVKFYDEYFSLHELLKYLQATDIYIATPLDPDQAVSGTFSYAIGTGRAVVSTEFSQAKESITRSMGYLVPTKSPEDYAKAIIDILKSKTKHRKMHHAAYKKTRSMIWPNVAHEYLRVLNVHILPSINLSYLKKMTDDLGILQFGKLSIPSPEFGYTLDDNARALVVSNWLTLKNKSKVYPMLRTYLHFIKTCQSADGKFINYIASKDSLNSSQNSLENLEDAYGRAMWALAETITNKTISPQLRKMATIIWDKAFIHSDSLEHLRARAFLVKAISIMLTRKTVKNRKRLVDVLRMHSDFLSSAYSSNSQKGWNWYEPYLTYSNAMFPETLIVAGQILKDDKYLKIGKDSLNFLVKHTFMGDVYVPIGQNGWFRKGAKRSNFDQQPEDPAAMVLALAMAYETFGEEKYRKLAIKCFSWFLGNNLLGVPVYEPKNGGVYDGITKYGVNKNQGSESLVSYLMSRIIIEEIIFTDNENRRN